METLENIEQPTETLEKHRKHIETHSKTTKKHRTTIGSNSEKLRKVIGKPGQTRKSNGSPRKH